MNGIRPERDGAFVGRLALGLCLGGILLSILFGITAQAFDYDARALAYLLFVAFQIGAIVVGYRGRQVFLAKASAISASILLVLSFGLVG